MTCCSFLIQASFDQGRSILVQRIVHLCQNQITDADTSAAYELVARQGVWLTVTIACSCSGCTDCIIIKYDMTVIGINMFFVLRHCSICPMHYAFHYAYIYLQRVEDVVKHFLLAEVYAGAPSQTLSEDDWNQRKAVIFLKSVFFNSTEGESFAPKMEEVHNYLCILINATLI